MPKLWRNFVPGGCYIFTVSLRNRRSNLLTRHIDDLQAAIRTARAMQPFTIHAWVVLPDHMHCMCKLPDGDTDYVSRWRIIRTVFAKAVGGSPDVWQPQYWEQAIHSAEEYRAYVDYVHMNPVKHGLVQYVVDWPFSSFHRFVAEGIYSRNWAGTRENPIAKHVDDWLEVECSG